MSKKRIIGVAIVLALILFIGGMIAYFTDVTDPKTNVFTLGGDVDITLNETFSPSDAVGIHPGAEVTKEPSIANASTTTPAYVFMKVTVPCYASGGTSTSTVDTPLYTFKKANGSTGVNDGWTLVSTSSIDASSKTITYVYAYTDANGMKSLAPSASTPALFNKVVLSDTLTSAQTGTAPQTPNVVVKGYGIQVDSLGEADTPAEIFALFGNN